MRLLLLFFSVIISMASVCQSRISIPAFDSLGKAVKIDSRKYEGYKYLLVNVDPMDSTYSQFGDLVTLSSRISKCIVIILPINCSQLSKEELTKFFSPVFRSGNLFIAEPESSEAKRNGIVNKWLATKAENGHVDFSFSSPMQKVLMGRSGELEAIFGPKMRPLDSHIIQAISR